MKHNCKKCRGLCGDWNRPGMIWIPPDPQSSDGSNGDASDRGLRIPRDIEGDRTMIENDQ